MLALYSICSILDCKTFSFLHENVHIHRDESFIKYTCSTGSSQTKASWCVFLKGTGFKLHIVQKGGGKSDTYSLLLMIENQKICVCFHWTSCRLFTGSIYRRMCLMQISFSVLNQKTSNYKAGCNSNRYWALKQQQPWGGYGPIPKSILIGSPV